MATVIYPIKINVHPYFGSFNFNNKAALQRFVKSQEESRIAHREVIVERIKQLYPQELENNMESYPLELTQKEVDLIHLVLGFVTDKEAQSILNQIDGYVSKEVYETWDKVYHQVDTEDGLSITVK